MNRSGYVEDLCSDDPLVYGRWRAQVKSAIRGKRGQAFLKELAEAMDAMPEKVLISSELINSDGDCCTIGVVCKARGVDVSKINYEDPEQVGESVNIAHQLAAEIEWENDENWYGKPESPEDRWKRMRKWVDSQIIKDKASEK
ncbi:hypothetical protein KOR42_05690 [Thalassoglobus neptunius]|uniref:Uncharacterized protein n=1 Tax=Thalassoglobus neptunius TaxID=1938619 RepID=A0A5C5X4G1_9PLAN|nr:hypothetical protein [Thalassoglobus neptunius]TWT57211.1 hypothetical protein KOR42_05690 [Thalassoglobus neptunius]